VGWPLQFLVQEGLGMAGICHTQDSDPRCGGQETAELAQALIQVQVQAGNNREETGDSNKDEDELMMRVAE
jgi:hypothetical protein